MKFTLKQRIVDGKNAYIFWDAETADNLYEGAMDAFVVENGKIVAHFFSGKMLGHKDLATTQIYAKVQQEHLRTSSGSSPGSFRLQNSTLRHTNASHDDQDASDGGWIEVHLRADALRWTTFAPARLTRPANRGRERSER